VYLPAGDAASGAQVAPVSDEGTRSLDRTRVLVMDDEPLVREMVRRMLQGGGCDVVTAESGVQALDVCRRAAQEGRPFDVAILDLTLRGGMGGLEVFERLGEEYPGLPAILSSGYGQPAVESVGRRPAAVLPKPYRSHELLACVRSVVSSAGSAGH
jgi:CheY-like chemotaxis protein